MRLYICKTLGIVHDPLWQALNILVVKMDIIGIDNNNLLLVTPLV